MSPARLRSAALVENATALVLQLLPLSWAVRLGGWLGERHARGAIAADRAWVRRLRRNLGRWRPADPAGPAGLERQVLAFSRQVGQVYAEIPRLAELCAAGRVELVGREHLAAATGPVILAGCHCANWELIGRVVALLDGPSCALYLPLASPVRDRLARRSRACWTPLLSLIPASAQAMRRIVREVSRGHHLVLFVDEEKDGHVWAPAFGRRLPDSGNRWFAARLAVQHGMAIVPVFVERRGLARYRVVIEPALRPAAGLPQAERVRRLAGDLDGRVEAWLQPRLDQWLWLPYLEPDRPLPTTGRRAAGGGASTTSHEPSGR